MAFRRIKPLWMESSTGGGGGLPIGTTTDQIPEGIINLYFSGKTSDDLPEGTVNLFFTDGERLRLANDVELIANKSDDIFLDSTSDIKYPTVRAVAEYVDSIELGLLDDRGNWNASGGIYPNANGSGPGGVIAKGDIWYISVAGNLGGTNVYVGDSVRALTDNPGQTASNWDILNVGLGYIPEDVANKSPDITLGDMTSSDELYPTQNAVKTYVDNSIASFEVLPDQFGNQGKYLTTDGTTTSWEFPNFIKCVVIPIDSTSSLTLPTNVFNFGTNEPSVIVYDIGLGELFVPGYIAEDIFDGYSNATLSVDPGDAKIIHNSLNNWTGEVGTGNVIVWYLEETPGIDIETALSWKIQIEAIMLQIINTGIISGGLGGATSDLNTASKNIIGAINELLLNKEDIANKSPDITLGDSTASDELYPTQNAVKTYVDTAVENFDHNHTGPQDGGILTNEIHDGYSDYIGTQSTPTNPTAGTSRLYNFETVGRNFLEFLHSDGIIIRLGRDTVYVVRCMEDTGIAKHKAVYCNGATGGRPNVYLAKADNELTMPALGITMTAMTKHNYGLVMFSGKLWKIDTDSWNEGDRIYVSPDTAGELTNVKPTFPDLIQQLGEVGTKNQNNGTLLLYHTSFEKQIDHTQLTNIGTLTHAELDELIPDLLGHEGEFLSTDGTSTVWSGYIPEDVANKSDDETLGDGTSSDILYPTQNAVKVYVDNQRGLPVDNLVGVTENTRYVGATSSGPPVAGTFQAGDFVIDPDGDFGDPTILLENLDFNNFKGINSADPSNPQDLATKAYVDAISSRSLQLPITTVLIDTTLDGTHYTILVNATNGNRIIYLPTAIGITGRIYNIKKIDNSNNSVTIQAFGSQTIDDSNIKVINNQYTSLSVQSNNVNWFVI